MKFYHYKGLELYFILDKENVYRFWANDVIINPVWVEHIEDKNNKENEIL